MDLQHSRRQGCPAHAGEPFGADARSWAPEQVTPQTADHRTRHAAHLRHCTVTPATCSPALQAQTSLRTRSSTPAQHQRGSTILNPAAAVPEPARHALQLQQDTLDPLDLAHNQVGDDIPQAHLLESGVWTSSTSLMRPPASRPSSYLVSTSSRPLLSATAWPLANSRSARADACAKHAPYCHPTLCAVPCWRWSQVWDGAADRAGPAPRMPTLVLHPGLATSVVLNRHADRVVGESEDCCQVKPQVFRSVPSNRHDHALGPCQALGRQPQR